MPESANAAAGGDPGCQAGQPPRKRGKTPKAAILAAVVALAGRAESGPSRP